MLKNYFKIAWRNIIKNRFYSAVNIFGLSTGIAFTLLIAGYIWNELQVNNSLKNKDRQYIIQSKWKDPNQGFYLATLGPLAKALRETYPNLVANYYRFDGISSNISKGDKSFRENLQIGDSTFLDMYGFKLLNGNPRTALQNPFSVVITIDKALKYFGKTDVVGQTISIDNFSGSKHDFIITGVLDKLSKNSVTSFVDNYPGDFYVSIDNLDFFGRNMSWQNSFIVNYIELQKGVNPKQIEKLAAQVVKQNASPQIAADLTPYLLSLKEYYLTSNNGLVKKMLYALSAIALFILLMAIVNFVNMSVSRSAARMREMGIRKVLGGLKKQLITQFLVESILIVFFSTLFALIVYGLTQNLLSTILGKPVPSLVDFPLYFSVFPVLFVLLIGFIAGIYPAFVLSSLKSIDSLKGKLVSIKENVLLRKSLIVFQFVTATVAFIGAIIISKQVNLFLSKNLGYDKDYIFSAQAPRDWTPRGVQKMENIRNQFATMPELKDVAFSFEIPDGNNSGDAKVYRYGSDSTQALSAQALTTDENYLNVYKIPLKAGAFFEGHRRDSGKIIMNEEAILALGFKNASDAIGQQIRVPLDPTVFTIKGVTSDFHFSSMQQKVAPMVFFNLHFAPIYRYFSFRINPGNISASVAAIRKKWNALMPGVPFEYKFMDDTLTQLYQSEIRLKKASYTATGLALIIVLLGVLGLISLSIQKRTKEIGIRKVLGASVVDIVSLFNKEILPLVLVAGLVACPAAWLLMNGWLNDYAYRIPLTAKPFVVSIFGLAFITAILITIQTIKAGTENPVKSLRTE
jgi:putative ABC transport system permease protein